MAFSPKCMSKLKSAKKVLSFVSCLAISLGVAAAYPASTGTNDASAKTIAEIQQQRKENQDKIAALETEISSLQDDKDNNKAYQETLMEQIGLIQANIELLNAELESIEADISVTAQNITDLDTDIVNQQDAIDQNIELFKERLCAMYMNGNDSAATVVLGSSSFYDMMTRLQMINRIAEYDEELITNILDEIDSMEQSKKNLESEKLNLQMKQEEQQKRKDEKAAEIEDLNIKMKDTEDEIARIAMEQESLARDKADIEAENQALAEEQAAIEEQIRREAEEAQRRYEEEQRRLAEERAAAQRAAAEAAAAAAAQQSSGDSSQSTYVAPTYTEPEYIVPSVSSLGFAWPVPGFCYISSGYGYRWGTTHKGIDIGDAGISGAAVVASQAGTVIRTNNTCSHNYAKSSSCGCGGGYGNYVVISHDGTYSTLYGHMASTCVNPGDYVEQGQVIGYVGSTGWSTGAHLHFEVQVNGVCNDPMNYVSP
jgi:murein DD-endopeptidase MepM/ murein hydrolase activator NlpD